MTTLHTKQMQKHILWSCEYGKKWFRLWGSEVNGWEHTPQVPSVNIPAVNELLVISYQTAFLNTKGVNQKSDCVKFTTNDSQWKPPGDHSSDWGIFPHLWHCVCSSTLCGAAGVRRSDLPSFLSHVHNTKVNRSYHKRNVALTSILYTISNTFEFNFDGRFHQIAFTTHKR